MWLKGWITSAHLYECGSSLSTMTGRVVLMLSLWRLTTSWKGKLRTIVLKIYARSERSLRAFTTMKSLTGPKDPASVGYAKGIGILAFSMLESPIEPARIGSRDSQIGTVIGLPTRMVSTR